MVPRSPLCASLAFAALSVAALAAVPRSADAETLGIQFSGHDLDRNLLPTEAAGLVPSLNYNVISGYPTSTGVGGDVDHLDMRDGLLHTLPALKNSSGAATTVVGTANGFQRLGTFGSIVSPTPDHKLLSHEFGENPTVFGSQTNYTGTLTFTNLNANGFTSYDLIVYLALDTGDTNDHPTTFILNGGTPLAITVDGNSSYATPDVVFVDAAANPVGNYLRFNGLTGDTLTMGITSSPYFNSSGFAGLQIIQAEVTNVPEAGTLGILVCGCSLLIASRRKRA